MDAASCFSKVPRTRRLASARARQRRGIIAALAAARRVQATDSKCQECVFMPENRDITTESEPIGIIISQGRLTEVAPRFSAYVWGVAEEKDEDLPLEKARS